MSEVDPAIDVDETPDEAARLRMGQLLAEARVDQGLTIEEIAGRLNLRPSFVAAIESGRGDEHMDWSYERNHIRTIAALLAIDVQPALEGDLR